MTVKAKENFKLIELFNVCNYRLYIDQLKQIC